MYRKQALKAIFNLRCNAAYTIPPYPMWGIISDTTNLINFKRCMRCMWPQRAQNPIYLLKHLFEVIISRCKSFIQNKTKVVNLGDNFAKNRPYQQCRRWNINPATTNHYYLTLCRIQLKTIRTHPFMHAHSCVTQKYQIFDFLGEIVEILFFWGLDKINSIYE
jgi:hypothetical protein